MARETLISVIMSVHNAEAYLKEAVESILSQTFKDFEFIVVDDASSDNSLKILESYPEIKIIKNTENLGLTKSLNIALRQAKGEYIARMDADDISLPNRLEVQKNFLDKNPHISVVGSAVEIIDGKKKTVHTEPKSIEYFMKFKNIMSHPTVMFRKKDIMSVGAYDENFKYAQDYDLWSKLLGKGYKIANIDSPLLRYRIHENSITQGKTKDLAYEIAMSIAKRNSPILYDAFLLSLHRQTVKTFKDMVNIIFTWFRLYNKNFWTFALKQQIYTIWWYIKGKI